MSIDLVKLRAITLRRTCTPAELRVMLGIDWESFPAFVQELIRLAESGKLRLRRLESAGWSIAAFEWGGA